MRSMHIKRHVFSSSMQTFEDVYQKDFFLDPKETVLS